MALDDTVALIRMKLGHLTVQRDPYAYVRGLVDLCAQAAGAERCTLYLVDHERAELRARQSHVLAADTRLPIGHGIAGAVAQTGETVNLSDADGDPRFDAEVDARGGERTRNMLVVPIWSTDRGRVTGVIEVRNKRTGTFERGDQMNLELIADGVAAALERIGAAIA